MKALAYIFIFFCFFPYLSIIGLETDTQPNGLILGSLLLFAIKDKRINTPIIMLWILFGLSLLLVFYNNAGAFTYVKNSLNYLSPPLLALATYNAFLKLKVRVPFSMFMSFLFIYFFVGFMQLHFVPDFMVSFLSRGQVLFAGRGVISLSSEPAFYATMCLFLMVFSLVSYNKKQNYLAIGFLLFQMVYLARSATGFAILGLALIIFCFFQILKLRFKYLSYAIVLAGGLALAFNYGMKKIEETRVGVLADAFIENPMMITQFDASAGVRVTGAVAPFLAYKHYYMKPMGLGYYKPFLLRFYFEGKYRKLLSKYIVFEKDRLGGSINLVMYQLGFLGLLFPIAICLSFRKLIRKDSAFFAMILFMTILFTQIQLMQSFIGFMIGYALYLSNREQGETHVSQAVA